MYKKKYQGIENKKFRKKVRIPLVFESFFVNLFNSIDWCLLK